MEFNEVIKNRRLIRQFKPTEYEGRQAKGYAYFKIVSDMEMKMKYDLTGTCPSEFPENGSVVYYR